MKAKSFLSLLVLVSAQIFSQNVGIGTENPVTKLDIRGNSTDDGGTLQISNSDQSHRLLLFGGRENDPNPFIFWEQGDPLRFTTNEGGWSEKMRITSEGKLAVGTETPDNSALVEFSSPDKGFLPPRMTASQRNAISSPAAGLLVFQTDSPSGYYYYTGSEWYGLLGISSAGNAFSCIDYDGNAYPVFTLGTQVWMAENLRVTHYRNGEIIPLVTGNVAWAGLTTGAYTWYNNDQGNYEKYGIMYNWYAVDDSRGLCPDGWHIPTEANLLTIMTYLGSIVYSGGKMKSLSPLWAAPNANATNSTGFSGLPGGYRWIDGSFGEAGTNGYWWTSTQFSTTEAWHYRLINIDAYLNNNYHFKQLGLNVRCVRDN